MAGSRPSSLGREAESSLAGEAAASEKRNGCLRMLAESPLAGVAELPVAARERAATLSPDPSGAADARRALEATMKHVRELNVRIFFLGSKKGGFQKKVCDSKSLKIGGRVD